MEGQDQIIGSYYAKDRTSVWALCGEMENFRRSKCFSLVVLVKSNATRTWIFYPNSIVKHCRWYSIDQFDLRFKTRKSDEIVTLLIHTQIGNQESDKVMASSLEIHRLITPATTILQAKNATIKKKALHLPRSTRKDFILPTMYKGWNQEQNVHLKIKYVRHDARAVHDFEEDVLIFDTFGTSSYYHLLIDHIIPVWITRCWCQSELSIFKGKTRYWRVSRNKFNRELDKARDIFEYFLGEPFVEDLTGDFANVIYGYFYSHRPYQGNRTNFLQDYSSWLGLFRDEFCIFPEISRKSSDVRHVLVPVRSDRNFDFVKRFISKYSRDFQFDVVDFGAMGIESQIKVAGNSSVIFGDEGAAFANTVFMPANSLVIPVSNDDARFEWHSTLSSYLGHEFCPVRIDGNGNARIDDAKLANRIHSHFV